MNRKLAWLGLIAALLALAWLLSSCSDASGPSVVLDGTWAGDVKDAAGLPVDRLTLRLSEQNGTVTGSADVAGFTGFTASGSYHPPDLTVHITDPAFQPMTYTGTVAQSQITGHLNGGGFVNATANLFPQ